MSVEYVFFLRNKPILESASIGAMALEVRRYEPRAGDPIASEPWRDAVRWVIAAYGRITDYDAWRAFARRTCDRYGGKLWVAATEAIDPLDDVVLGDEEDDDAAARRREQAEDAAFMRLIERAASSPEAMQQLRRADTMESFVFRAQFSSTLVRLAGTGAPLAPWKWALRHLKDLHRVAALQTARSRAALAKRGALAAAIVERFEAKQARDAARGQQVQARARVREATARRDALVKWLAEPDVDPPLIERRRRGGEKLAGIPRSTTALLTQGKLAAAIEDYATRYGLSRQVARAVVSPHMPAIVDAFRNAAPAAPATRARASRRRRA